MSEAAKHDAIVIGAGIVGAACARALALDGLDVLVLDASFAAGGTTAAGMGHIVVMDDSPEQLALTSHSVELWRSLAPMLPPSVEMDHCGTIWVAEDSAQMDAVLEKQATYASHGIRSQVLTGNALRELEPNLRPGLAGGLLVPGDGVVYQPNATHWLLEQAKSMGATVREGARVEALLDRGVRIKGETILADVIVNAAGAEAARLMPELPIIPRKGHLAVSDRAPGFCRHQLVELGYLKSAHVMTTESVAFNVQPRATGQVLIGSSRELVGWDASMNRRVLAQMLARAAHFMPALTSLSIVRTWTGFRPATADKLPLIGAWPALAGHWIVAGHEGLGITTSLASAEMLADLVAGRATAIPSAAFAPARVLGATVAVA